MFIVVFRFYDCKHLLPYFTPFFLTLYLSIPHIFPTPFLVFNIKPTKKKNNSIDTYIALLCLDSTVYLPFPLFSFIFSSSSMSSSRPIIPLLTLLLTTGFMYTSISYVHYAPIRDKEEMRKGIKREKEIEKWKRREE